MLYTNIQNDSMMSINEYQALVPISAISRDTHVRGDTYTAEAAVHNYNVGSAVNSKCCPELELGKN